MLTTAPCGCISWHKSIDTSSTNIIDCRASLTVFNATILACSTAEVRQTGTLKTAGTRARTCTIVQAWIRTACSWYWNTAV